MRLHLTPVLSVHWLATEASERGWNVTVLASAHKGNQVLCASVRALALRALLLPLVRAFAEVLAAQKSFAAPLQLT